MDNTPSKLKKLDTETVDGYFYRLAQMSSELKDAKYGSEEYLLKQQINEIVFEKVNMYIWDFLHKTYPTYMSEFPDLYNECIAEVLEQFPKYDGAYSMTTFCKRNINHACFEYVAGHFNLSRYTNEVLNHINRAKIKLRQQGIRDEDMTDADIAALCGPKITPSVVANALKLQECSARCEYDPSILDANKKFESPEEAYFKKESLEQLDQILACLLPYEKFVYCINNGYDVGDVTSPYRKMLQSFADSSASSAYADPIHKLSFAQIGADPEFVQAVKDAGRVDLITNGPVELKKHTIVCEHVPKEKVKIIYNKAKDKICSQPLVTSKLRESIEIKYYSDEISPTEGLMETIEILTNISFDD